MATVLQSNSPCRLQLRGATRELFESQDTEVVISGPAGTGKSCGAWAKLHFLCESVPGIRCLALRKTRESLTESGMVTFEQKVLPRNHAVLDAGGQRRMRQSYVYPNGSQITLGGMDKPSKTLSTEFDVAYVQEATELREDEWEMLLRPLRNNRLPYQQLMADTNPDAPNHWIKKRERAGKLRLLNSRHEDNPALYAWNPATESWYWTPDGVAYIAKLDALTGVRKARLRFGQWVQAEGVVYDEFSSTVHVVDRFDIPLIWERYWGVDFGYIDPFCCGFWAKDLDGRLWQYRYIYHSRKLYEDQAARMLFLFNEEVRYYARRLKLPEDGVRDSLRPKAIICDHDREGRETLAKHLKMATTPAKKDIAPGIQMVQARLRKQDNDGKPRVSFLRGSLDQRDPELERAKKIEDGMDEFGSYVWDDKKELPVDDNNHLLDQCRYVIAHFDLRPGWEAPTVESVQRARQTEEEDHFRFGDEMGRQSRLYGR